MSLRYESERHHRRSIRLKGYDYRRAGAYFVTICTQGRVCLFGEAADGAIRLHDAGRMVEQQWLGLNDRFPAVETDVYVIMPNHVHGIVIITSDVLHDGATLVVAPTGIALGDVVGAFRSLTTLDYINGVKMRGWPPFSGRLWHRNYYEHIIRSEADLNRIRQYIINNPARWTQDDLYGPPLWLPQE